MSAFRRFVRFACYVAAFGAAFWIAALAYKGYLK